MASASSDGMIKIRDIEKEICTATIKSHSYSIRALTVLSNSRIASGARAINILWIFP